MAASMVQSTIPFGELVGIAAGLSFWLGLMLTQGARWAHRAWRAQTLARLDASFEARLTAQPTLYAVYDALPHLMWFDDGAGRRLSVNARWRDYTGQKVFMREGWDALLHPDDHARCAPTLKNLSEQGKPCILECRLRRHDGVFRWHRIRGFFVQPHEHDSRVAVGMALDVEDQKATIARLDTIESRMAAVIRDAPVALWAVDRDGMVTFSQGKALSYWGREQDQGVGQSIFDVTAQTPVVGEAVRAAMQGQAGHHLSRSGEYSLETYYAPLISGNGEVQGAVGLTLDVSERVRADATDKESKRLSAIIEAQHRIATGPLDAQLIMRDIVDSISQLCGADGASIQMIEGASLCVLMAQGIASAAVNARLDIEHSLGGTCVKTRQSVRINDANTDERVARQVVTALNVRSIMVAPLQNRHGVIGVLSCGAKRAAAFDDLDLRALEMFASLLATLVGQANEFDSKQAAMTAMQVTEKQLTLAREQAESATRHKSEFLANMSHEIRTPLNGIIGLGELLADTGLNVEQQRLATLLQNSGKHLLNLVNDVLDFSKLESGKFELELTQFDLAQLIDDQIALLSSRADERGLDVSSYVGPDIASLIYGDVNRLGQILLNLINNAIKFTASGGVTVTASLVAPPDDAAAKQLRVCVEDTGIGIAATTQSKLFTPFTQADGSMARRFGGTGLGLSICRKLIETMGGQIGVQSVYGQGSTFWFELPYRPIKSGAPVTQSAPLALPNTRVWLVALGEMTQKTTVRYLHDQGAHAEVLAAPSTAAARFLACAEAGDRPHVIVLGDDSDDFSGLKELEAALSPRAAPELRFVVVSAQGTKQWDAHRPQTRPVALLHKPMRLKLLRQTLLDAMGITPARVVVEKVAAASTPTTASVSTLQGRVLVVDDNAVNLIVAVAMLKKMGCVTQTASNGREALAVLRQQSFDLVLMDCQMPEMDGYEATRCIRRGEAGTHAQIPIVALTANALSDDRDKCVQSGMNDYLAKPIDRARLQLILAQFLAGPGEPSPKTTQPRALA